MHHTNKLLSVLSEKSGTILDVSLWFNFYSFDVMGDLVFGKSFEMMEKREEHFAVKLLHEAMKPFAFLTPIPWLLPILSRIPGAATDFLKFIKYSEDMVDAREKVYFFPAKPPLF